MDKVGIGVIGTGFSQRVQIPAFLDCPGARIVSVASAKETNARAAAERFGVPHWTADWKETVAHPEVDLICVTTPPRTHREMVLRSLAAGKHVLAEKPMAMTAEEAAEMVRAAASAKVLAVIDHELRFLPGRLKAYEMVRAGEIGVIRHARCDFRAPHRGDPQAVWNWWSDRGEGGGALGAIGSHSIDSLLWFLGADVESVFCSLKTHITERKDGSGVLHEVTSDDEANLILRFGASEWSEDATATVSVSMAEYPEYRNRVELFGSENALRIDARGELYVGDVQGGRWVSVPVDTGENVPGNADTGFARAFRFLAKRIVETLAAGGTEIEQAATFADGLRVQLVLDAARESHETGRAVRPR